LLKDPNWGPLRHPLILCDAAYGAIGLLNKCVVAVGVQLGWGT